ncbi:MAG TPA: hypothetical protein VN112_16350 [Ensifer sp.]|nr:hypothetical protein [Ensifer sp.]
MSASKNHRSVTATTTKTLKDGTEQVLLDGVIFREKPSRKRAKRVEWTFSVELQRMREIEKVIRHRHGGPIPDPSGSDDVDLCKAYLKAAAFTPSGQDMAAWANVFAPWANPVEVQLLASQGRNREKMLGADAVAKMLFVTLAERTKLGLKTIGACDVSKDDRLKLSKQTKRERDRNRQRDKRAAQGRMDRASYEAASLTKLAPWEEEGISRRTWERRRVASLSRVEVIHRGGDTLASTSAMESALPQYPSETESTGIAAQSKKIGQDRVAGLVGGPGDHLPAEVQEAAPHGSGNSNSERAA